MNPLGTAPRATLAEYVVGVIRDEIARGELRPGEHLRETELAAALDVSRGPVREALAILESEGQVEIRRHRGAFVSVLTQKDVEEVHTLRAAIEVLAAERATVRLSKAHLTELDRILAAMKNTSGAVAPEEAVRLDLAFHDVLYDAADHARLRRVWASIRSQVAFFLHVRNVNFPDFPTVGHVEHLELRTVLSQGDPVAARVAVEKHMTGSFARLSRLELPSDVAG
ncbi:GntR family transcriptional regulator [Krasilnikoviella flava]|uniref:DNA-binding transcriptional regulator, GntR family n=1 Tax=Krasilnikoviella flava TaxID=526729 RepID=A0A1T5KUP3_9MICO|nr:GntR family transcriptional regulator [Krasilnikoviella flava]SKC67373.1 DNA-binding transcriptional regulator, GntR family [Krasilnikoviella flava]